MAAGDIEPDYFHKLEGELGRYLDPINAQASEARWQNVKDFGKIYGITAAGVMAGVGWGAIVEVSSLNGASAFGAMVVGDGFVNAATGSAFRYNVLNTEVTAESVAIDFTLGMGLSVLARGLSPGGGYAATRASEMEIVAAENASARHLAWSSDLGAINDTVAGLGQRALRNSGGDWVKSEALFNRYLSLADARLARTGSNFGVELQPAAIAGGERVPSFIWRHRRDGSSPLILGRDGTPQLFAYRGSLRLDAGIIDLSASANQYGLRPVVSGYDISLSANKSPIGGYYRDYFGNIPISDIRLRTGN